jgi:PAS domain S-box-containing protein
MKDKDKPPGGAEDLRRRAEEIARHKAARFPENRGALSPEETQSTLYELQTHQIELEMQNEELRRAQEELDAARARYFDLYDLAPVGYCTLSGEGSILEANLASATLLGVARGKLVEQPISRFILVEDQDVYYLHRKRLLETGTPQSCDLRMMKKNGTAFWAHLEATGAKDADGVPVCRVIMSDITERKYQEDERELTARLIVLVNSPGDLRNCMSNLTASLQGWSACEAVGVRLRAGDDYPYYETRGFPPEFVHEENRLCVYGPDGTIARDGAGNPVLGCMCGNILRGRFDPARPFFTSHGSFWSNNTTALLKNTTEADRLAHTRNRCNTAGYESVALVPLRAGDHVFGLLQFNDRRPDRFTPGLIAHFERIADSLAIALSRRQAEEALRESEERFQQLFDHMADGVAVYKGVDEGRDFVFVDMNRTGQAVSKVSRDETIGRRITEVFPGVERMGLLDVLRRVWQTGLPERHPLTEYKDGRISEWVENYVYKLPSGLIVAIYSDTSEKHRAEAERERLMAAIEQSGEMIVITDPEGTIQYVNPAFTSVTGYGRDEAIGQNPRMLKSGEQDPAFYRELWRTLSSGKSWQGTFVNERKDGKTYVEDATISPVCGPDGRIVSYVAVKRDITAQRLMEEQLRQAQKMETVGQLAGGVAHDFNNMLHVIISYVEMALEKVEDGQPLHKYLLEIRRAAQRSAQTTRQLLAFARKQTVSPKVLDLNEAVAGTQKMIRQLIGEDIELAWIPGQDLWKARMDPSQLDQVLANLAVNARDAIGGVGKLTVETGNVSLDQSYCASHAGFLPGEYVLLAVSDDGCGMDKETMSHLFEPFFTTKGPGKGTGLGLATIYGIVKQNGGFISAYSEPGEGTAFKVYLPRAEGEAAAERFEIRGVALQRGTETVLVVEDEAAILELARESLGQLGYRVLTASSPDDAIRLSGEHAGLIHLLITDVVMPHMNGRQLAELLGARRSGLKCLYMSGYTADVIANRGVLKEGVRFISKPFSIATLADKVREVLDE